MNIHTHLIPFCLWLCQALPSPSSVLSFPQSSDPPVALFTFFALLCLAQFFENFGPNTTTFIIPGELFPTRYRSTADGIAAASGKLGAVLAQIVFTYVNTGSAKTKIM